MAKMIGVRDEVIRTKVGHVVNFAQGEETFVPEDNTVIKQCVEAGHKMVKEAPVRKPEPVPETPSPVKKVVGRPAAAKPEAKS